MMAARLHLVPERDAPLVASDGRIGLNFPKQCAMCGAPFTINHECAPRRRSLRLFRLQFESDGACFVWRGPAETLQDADAMARSDLADDNAGFDRRRAVLTAAEETLS